MVDYGGEWGFVGHSLISIILMRHDLSQFSLHIIPILATISGVLSISDDDWLMM